ncbi:aryl-alcohol dehydrogenase [Polymorphobacter multimanifer]|uniref:Aryl-alcohol dehydrogenase-like predicted oxidoreductase n=1 Tax=Polymorphobacter multimanifer TaxID=1070431 RepID=A0A841LBU6_9SPHN|nr:aldo/keto reductase [Polymorphobacter multimanifer]MBB6226468.1 aryl-alcohol dehydrogenase-like predicted oxidoreductase [Polymorphobacter multimanifer]GGI87327.1 aryl-alcohol dehydrogenase [Polymorphobacter multimanifer]
MTDIALSPELRPLGKSPLMVSPLAWGMWRFAGDDVSAARRLVEAALAAGITFLDTADIYGPDNDEPFGASEVLLGRVLAEAPQLRDAMVLASKGGICMGVPYDSSPVYLRQAVEASLTRLGVERIDLWQIHRPDMLAHPAETAVVLDAMVAEGKIGAIGVSNHTPAQTRALAAHLESGIVSTQPEFSALALAPLEDGTFDLALEAGHAVMAWSPLGQGRLGSGDPRPGRMQAQDPRTERVIAALQAQANAYGVSVQAAAYAWIMAHPTRPIPIIGSQNPARIAEAADAFKVRWTRAEWYGVLVASKGENLP